MVDESRAAENRNANPADCWASRRQDTRTRREGTCRCRGPSRVLQPNRRRVEGGEGLQGCQAALLKAGKVGREASLQPAKKPRIRPETTQERSQDVRGDLALSPKAHLRLAAQATALFLYAPLDLARIDRSRGSKREAIVRDALHELCARRCGVAEGREWRELWRDAKRRAPGRGPRLRRSGR